MGTMQWRAHFRDSVERPRTYDFEQGIQLDPDVKMPLIGALRFFQRGLNSAGLDLRTKVRKNCSPEYIECIDLYVREKSIHAELLAQLLWAGGAEPGRRNVPDFLYRRLRRRLQWQPELVALLTGELVMLPVMRVIANQAKDPLVAAVVNDIIYDQSFHIGFHLDHLREEVRKLSAMQNVGVQALWASFFASSLTVLLAECHPFFDAIAYPRLTCWTDAWNLFSLVQGGLNGSDHLNSNLMRDGRIRFAL